MPRALPVTTKWAYAVSRPLNFTKMASDFKSKVSVYKLYALNKYIFVVSNPPNDLDIISVSEKISAALENDTEWKKFGMLLLQTKNKDDLALNKGNSLLEKCTGLLDLWKKRNPKPEWEQVIETLNKVKLNHLATELEAAIVIEQPQNGGHTHHNQAGEQVLKP